jgi:serine/threonine protein kinase
MEEIAFGRYRLLSLIGEGGMGKVYKAHDTEIGRDVAIKVLPPELSAEPGYRERFRREAHTAARLTEPHIIPVHDTGEIDGRLYLVMPIVDGVDVHQLLQRDGAMSPQRAVQVIEQLAAALDAAHEAGLVHRDVKPSNALLTRNDFVYLIDFGIAHDAAATKLTQTGSIIGTFAYMSPERLDSGTADGRSDVYALACVLYECLTGAQPFGGDSMEQQVVAHLTLDPPKPSSLDPAIPRGFDDVIATGMAKDPENRYQTAGDLAAAARSALNQASTPTPTQPASQVMPPLQDTPQRLTDPGPPAARSKRKWFIAAALVLVVVVAVSAVLLRNVLSPKTASAELVLTGATDPGANAFMPPAAAPPPTNTQNPPTLQPHGNGPVVTQPLPGDRAGLYGGTLNNAECDREKMSTFLSSHTAQASAFVDALNTDPTLYWSGGRPLTAADIATYLNELTPTVLRLDTRVTNHGFDGNRPTTLQSVFQSGTAVFVDAHGVPRARCYCGNPLTAPSALTGDPQPVGTAWTGYNPGALAAVQPTKSTISNFVLVDVVTGRPFNRPAGTTGANDTAHNQPVAPPGPAPTPGQGPRLDIEGTYFVHWLSDICSGQELVRFLHDGPFPVTLQGNTVGMMGGSGPLNADGSFFVTINGGVGATVEGVFASESGHTVIRNGHQEDGRGICHRTFEGTKQ